MIWQASNPDGELWLWPGWPEPPTPLDHLVRWLNLLDDYEVDPVEYLGWDVKDYHEIFYAEEEQETIRKLATKQLERVNLQQNRAAARERKPKNRKRAHSKDVIRYMGS